MTAPAPALARPKVRLTAQLQNALLDCYDFTKRKHPYYWKQASMLKLEAMGLAFAERREREIPFWWLTDVGMAEAIERGRDE